MKPVSYQRVPSSLNAGYPSLAVEHPLSTPKVMYCEKCGFASMNTVEFKKHMVEHTGTRFYCFYCNSVSFSEAELNEHMKQHTTKYPLKCPHCGQGYMRKLCLVKHIERIHSKNISPGPAKPTMTKNPIVPISTAPTSAPTAGPTPPRPVVRVTVPTSSAPAVRLGKDDQRGKTLDTNVSNATNGNVECLSHLNGLIQHNRALTVSLPEEVSIPAGCLVELVDVKTFGTNGSKELKLRLISQQENTSVIKDAKAAVPQIAAPGKPLPSTLCHTNSVRSSSMDMCTVNRKQSEAKSAHVERPAAVPARISNNLPNVASKEKRVLKRASPEIINLDCTPTKVFKNILSPVREGNGVIRVTQEAPANLAASSPAVFSGSIGSRMNVAIRPPSMGTSAPQRVMDERKTAATEHPTKTVPPRRSSGTNTIQEVSGTVKLEPDLICVKTITAPKEVKGAVSLNQQTTQSFSSLNGLVTTAAQVRPPAILVNKGGVVNQTFTPQRTLINPLSIKAPNLSNHINSKVSTACTQGIRFNEGKTKVAKVGDVSKPESFPVISSVFSLSEQPEENQGSIQPLVMALRGIVMDKNHISVTTTQVQPKNQIKNNTVQRCTAPASGSSVQVSAKNVSVAHDVPQTQQTSESVKVEEPDILPPSALTQHDVHVKEEKSATETKESNDRSQVAASNSSPSEESDITPQAEAAAAVDSLPQMNKNDDVSSKFLTISLRRVQVGVWKKSKKGLKLGYKRQVPSCTVMYPMPLKEDQLVKRPSPNQPVVVLNHPRPRVSAQKASADSFADTGASETVPKCQILKMRLGKVMGQKYEVMGCTVGVSP